MDEYVEMEVTKDAETDLEVAVRMDVDLGVN